ncbi:MAG: stage III sporulation protein AA [Bacillota bacterium]|nr:stage III sporulation protein AA [Bacillota bacterium]
MKNKRKGDETMDQNTEKILRKLPDFMQRNMKELSHQILDSFEEIRIKTYQDTLVISHGKEYSLRDGDSITPEVLEETLNRLMDYSYYAYEEELAKGYITIEGGHRVGICGRVTLNEDKVHLIKDVSSLNIRRSRQIIGASDKIIKSVYKGDIKNTLIISPPKCGKTTILRDLARTLSNRGCRVGICDERSEIAGCYNGESSYDLGSRTDILDGCPKAEGIIMLIRAMAPDVIITDEIGRKEDVSAIQSALCAGVKIVTTIHGNSYEDVANSAIGELIENQIFETLIFLSATPQTGTVKKIMMLSGMKKGA